MDNLELSDSSKLFSFRQSRFSSRKHNPEMDRARWTMDLTFIHQKQPGWLRWWFYARNHPSHIISSTSHLTARMIEYTALYHSSRHGCLKGSARLYQQERRDRNIHCLAPWRIRFGQRFCQNSRIFATILLGVSPSYSGHPSGVGEVLQCGSIESINRGLLSICCIYSSLFMPSQSLRSSPISDRFFSDDAHQQSKGWAS